jgi:hypothetical protein
MIVSVIMTVTNNKKLPITNFQKQTQTNPILSHQKGSQTQNKAKGLNLKLRLFLFDNICAFYRDIKIAYFIGRKLVLLASAEPKAKPGSNVKVMEMT